MKNLILLITFSICLIPFAISQETPDGIVLIEGGEFLMGKDSETGSSSSPAHLVKVNSFYMDKYEVTNREYLAFCNESGHRLPEFWNTEIFRSGDEFLDYPVVGVNYWDAVEYAVWAGKRLPTEAEWEYAARGGMEGIDYPYGNEYREEKEKKGDRWENLIHAAGENDANGFGLYDMSGNVWEWVADRYAADYYSNSEYDNPKGPESGENRCIRGGSWHSGPGCKKVYYRKGLISNWCDFAVGFRCVKDTE